MRLCRMLKRAGLTLRELEERVSQARQKEDSCIEMSVRPSEAPRARAVSRFVVRTPDVFKEELRIYHVANPYMFNIIQIARIRSVEATATCPAQC